MYWWILVKLLEAQQIKESATIFICITAATELDKSMADEKATLPEVKHMLSLYKTALEICYMFPGVYDRDAATLRRTVATWEMALQNTRLLSPRVSERD